MKIILSPIFGQPVAVTKAGDALTIDGEVYDFSALPDGATLPFEERPSDDFAGPVQRIDGDLVVVLRLPHGNTPEQYQAFPEPLENVPDGPVDLPTNTETEITEEEVEGGINFITTVRKWHQDDVVTTVFVPYPAAPAEEEAEEAEDGVGA